MIPWWAVILCCIGFASWTAFCVMVGASIYKTSAQQAHIINKFNAENPIVQPWPDREN